MTSPPLGACISPSPRQHLQRFALPSDSAEAVQPNQLYGHHPCLSPERAIFFRFSLAARLRRGPSQERRPRSGFAGLALTRSTRGRHRVALAGGLLLAAVAGVSALGTVMAGALPRLEAFHRLPDAAPRLPLLPRGGGWRARPLVGWRVDCLTG